MSWMEKGRVQEDENSKFMWPIVVRKGLIADVEKSAKTANKEVNDIVIHALQEAAATMMHDQSPADRAKALREYRELSRNERALGEEELKHDGQWPYKPLEISGQRKEINQFSRFAFDNGTTPFELAWGVLVKKFSTKNK